MKRAGPPALTKGVIDSGLVQFGDFALVDQRCPYLARFDMLASYPTLLEACAEAAAQSLKRLTLSRLLCPVDALPFGTALSVRTGIPLVYSRGTNEPAAQDLVGAYDIGHRTLLVVNLLDARRRFDPWALGLPPRGAAAVGLEVMGCVALMRVGVPAKTGIQRALIDGVALAELLSRRGGLPVGQAVAMRAWAEASALA